MSEYEELLEEVKRLAVEEEQYTEDSEKLNKQISELTAYLESLRNDRAKVQEKLREARYYKRTKTTEIESLKRLQAQEEKQRALAEEYEQKAAELDRLTAQAKWREFAYDHQITGAKYHGVAHGGILADKRGLGKTLTSLIMADMLGARRVLVIAPNKIVSQFEDEIRHWAPARRS